MSGIEKEVDNLGRVAIPIEFRRRLGLKSNSKVFVSLEDVIIIISPESKHCALCGKRIEKQNYRLCNSCISKIKSEN